LAAGIYQHQQEKLSSNWFPNIIMGVLRGGVELVSVYKVNRQVYQKRNIVYTTDMKLYEPLRLRFEKPLWAAMPEFGGIDTILERHCRTHPEIIKTAEADVTEGTKDTGFGRQDTAWA